MKNFKPLVLLFAVLFFSSTLLSAQSTTSCTYGTIVAQSCVGNCGVQGNINYDLNICDAKVVPMCVNTISTNLCPSHRAIAVVRVNGQVVTSGDITSLGSSLSFSAVCGSNIDVTVMAYHLVKGIVCVQFGELDFALKI